MSLNSLWQKFPKYVWDNISGDAGRALTILGAFGWALSSLAQTTMIIKNKNIDQKEKKFLVPQEIADGVVNVSLFYTICSGIKKLADLCLERGRLITQSTDDVIWKLKNTPVDSHIFIKDTAKVFVKYGIISKEEAKNPLTAVFSNMEKFFNCVKDGNIIHENKKGYVRELYKRYSNDNASREILEEVNNAFKEYKSFKSGVGVIAAIAASVITTSIITPFVRNKVAGIFQKKLLEQQKQHEVTKPQITLTPPTKPVDIKPYTTQIPSVFSTFNKLKI